MPKRETYLLHIYRSRSVSGWQWAARLDHLADGEIRRFADPELLLAHLQALVQRIERAGPRTDLEMGVDGSPASTE